MRTTRGEEEGRDGRRNVVMRVSYRRLMILDMFCS
jgi:hypothetical protein